MVLDDNPEMLLVKLPIPLPSDVWLPLTVGLCDVPQHTPRAVTVELPSEVTLPPQMADVVVILETAIVVTVGALVCGAGGFVSKSSILSRKLSMVLFTEDKSAFSSASVI